MAFNEFIGQYTGGDMLPIYRQYQTFDLFRLYELIKAVDVTTDDVQAGLPERFRVQVDAKTSCQGGSVGQAG